MDLLEPHNIPYAVAIALLFMLAFAQLLGIGDGAIDTDLDVDVESPNLGSEILSFLGIGKLPLMVWLSLFLADFALIGFSIQLLFEASYGLPLPAALGTGSGLVSSLLITPLLAAPLARIWPRDETSAIRTENLLGKRGKIAVGTATQGNPARAVIKDRFGQPHNIMVEPHDASDELKEGDEILLVRKVGETFFAITGHGPFRLS